MLGWFERIAQQYICKLASYTSRFMHVVTNQGRLIPELAEGCLIHISYC